MLVWCLVGILLASRCDCGDQVGKEDALSPPAASTQPDISGPQTEAVVTSQESDANEPPTGTSGNLEQVSERLAKTTQAAAPEQPADLAQAAASSVPAFRPLVDAVEREWAILAAMGSRQIRYKVVRAGAATVAIEVAVFDQNKPLGLPATREELRSLDPLDQQAQAVKAKRSASATTIEAAGKVWDAVLYEDTWTDEEIRYIRRTWVSPQAPVFGTIRMELYGDDALEARLVLASFGR